MVTVSLPVVVYTIRLVVMTTFPFFRAAIKNGRFDQTLAWSNRPYTTGCNAMMILLEDPQRFLLTSSPLSLDHSNHEGLHISQDCAIVAIGERVDLPHLIHPSQQQRSRFSLAPTKKEPAWLNTIISRGIHALFHHFNRSRKLT